MTGPELLQIMYSEIKPAVGCTEPVAVALATAEAARLLKEDIRTVEVLVDPNIYKNGMGVFIPGTEKSGLPFAAALGALAGEPELALEVLRNVDVSDIARADGLVRENRVNVRFIPEINGIYVEALAVSAHNTAKVIISGRHEHIVYKEFNGDPVLDLRTAVANSGISLSSLNALSVGDIIDRVNGFSSDELSFLSFVIASNRGIAETGLEQPLGMGAGYKWQQLIKSNAIPADMSNVAKAYAAAAADARMSGRNLPVMSCAGSGNQGLMASLPVIIAADFLQPQPLTLYRALALSFLLTMYAKSHIGRLSALCGCAIAASLGAGAGIGYLLGLNKQGIANIINNLIGDISGMICDGAKPGCSLKLMTAVDAACQMALLAKEGVAIAPGSGIVCSAPEDSIRNIGMLSKPGMIETDRIILDMMLRRCADSLAG